MTRKLRRLVLLALMIASVLTTGAFAQETLNVALTNPFTGASAINNTNPYRFATFSQVYETLVAHQDGEYAGVLLESWEKIDDYTWKVKLFENITDSEGNPYTTADLAFVMDAQKACGHNASIYYEAGCVAIIDERNATITMNTDSTGAFYLVGTQVFHCTQEAYDASPDHLATMPIGTGPYTCSKYVEGNSCTLNKRLDYWKRENLPKASIANPDVIEISFVPEAVQMSIAIESKNVQLAGQVSMSIAGEVEAVDGVTTKFMTNGTYNGLGFNMNGRVVSDNKALREAIAYAIDPEGLIVAVYGGHAQQMYTYGIPTALDFDESWTTDIGYDPAKAMEKLAEAGYENGVSVTLLANNVGEDAQIAELVQAYLAGVGIECVLDYVDPATQKAKIAEGNWDLNLVGGLGVLDMSLFWGNLYDKIASTGMSMYFHNDPALYEIYDVFKAAGGKTEENLNALYEYEKANVTWQPLFNKQVFYALSGEYTDLFVNDVYMALPYLGTATK